MVRARAVWEDDHLLPTLCWQQLETDSQTKAACAACQSVQQPDCGFHCVQELALTLGMAYMSFYVAQAGGELVPTAVFAVLHTGCCTSCSRSRQSAALHLAMSGPPHSAPCALLPSSYVLLT